MLLPIPIHNQKRCRREVTVSSDSHPCSVKINYTKKILATAPGSEPTGYRYPVTCHSRLSWPVKCAHYVSTIFSLITLLKPKFFSCFFKEKSLVIEKAGMQRMSMRVLIRPTFVASVLQEIWMVHRLWLQVRFDPKDNMLKM